MKAEDITVEVRNKFYERLDIITPDRLNLALKVEFGKVGSWTLETLPGSRYANELKQAGAGIVVSHKKRAFASGRVTGWNLVRSTENPQGVIVFTGITDESIAFDRICYPDPTHGDFRKVKRVHDYRAGPCETLLHTFFDVNAGPSALPARRTHNLDMAPDLGRGRQMVYGGRYDVLGDVLTKLGVAGGISWRIIHEHTDRVVFRTEKVRDVSKTVRLNIMDGSLDRTEAETVHPTATHIIVGGKGKGFRRMFVEHFTTRSVRSRDSYRRRIERFVDDRQTNKRDELKRSANRTLIEEGVRHARVKFVTGDVTHRTFGVDWNLGDTVALIMDGREYKGVATNMVMTLNSDGLRVGIEFGGEDGAAEVDVATALYGALEVSETTADDGTDPDVPPIHGVLSRGGRNSTNDLIARISNLERNAESGDEEEVKFSHGDFKAGEWMRFARFPGAESDEGMVHGEFVVTSAQTGAFDIIKFDASVSFQSASIDLSHYNSWAARSNYDAIRFVRDPSDLSLGDGYLEIRVSNDKAQSGFGQINLRHGYDGVSSLWQIIEPVKSPVAEGSSRVQEQVGIFHTGRVPAQLQNGWRNSSTEQNYDEATLSMSAGSTVVLSGYVDGSSASSAAMLGLPPGMRPKKRLIFKCYSPNVGGGVRVDVLPSGAVYVAGESQDYRGPVSLSGITFKATN